MLALKYSSPEAMIDAALTLMRPDDPEQAALPDPIEHAVRVGLRSLAEELIAAGVITPDTPPDEAGKSLIEEAERRGAALLRSRQ
jgi:hypothetical protein